MKSKFQNLFKKNQDGKTPENQSKSELLQKIEKLETALDESNVSLNVVNESKQVLKRELKRSTEEMKLYKGHVEELETNTNKLS